MQNTKKIIINKDNLGTKIELKQGRIDSQKSSH